MSRTYKKSWVLCLSGANNSLRRVDDALATSRTDSLVIQPLIEAMWWVCVTDESLMAEYPSQWKENLRPGLPEMSVIRGLRWVRNRATHQITQWEIARPPFHWSDAHSIAPLGTVKSHQDHGRSEYIAELQGNDARDAIRVVIAAIKREAIGKLPP